MKTVHLFVVAWIAILIFPGVAPAADTTRPVIQSIAPPPSATVSNLSQVTITFSENVTGLAAADLLVNGAPALGLSGSTNRYTFTFAQPAPGLVQFTWDGSHGISDLAGNRFDETDAAAQWSGTLVDTIAPAVALVRPAPGATLGALTQIEINFTEAVTGVDAADLLINNQPAVAVTGSGAGPYLFSFVQPADGTVVVSWAGTGGILDTATLPNDFGGGAWTYTLDSAQAEGDVVLNEIMADNLTGLLDEDGESNDWIELFNRGTNDVNLLGWSLTDDPAQPGQWIFPSVTLNAGQYLLVFASGKDRAVGGAGTNHTNFRLGVSGYLGLFNATLPRQMVSEFSYPDQRGDISYGRVGANAFAYFARATPRAANNSATNFSGVVARPHASVNSGFFNQSFTVALACETFGATIYYTLNGDTPTPGGGIVYTGPVNIAGATNKAVVPLRVAAFKAGLLSSPVLTHTYIFPDFVLAQSAHPAGFPTNWVSGGSMLTTTADYEMDPQVLTNNGNAAIARQALTEIPTVSLVAGSDTFFAPNSGVYTARIKRGNQRAVNAEMFLPNGERVFQADCGFEVQGGSSPTDLNGDWKDKKLSLRLVLKGEFTTPKLHAKVFDDTPVAEFDTLILDAGLNFWWTHMGDADQRNRAKFITDQFTSDLMNNAGMVAQHGRFVHLYLNGLYWGLYDIHERMDAAAAASYLGGQKEEWDVLKHTGDSAGLQQGTLTNYAAMFTLARAGLASNTNYERLQTFLDVPWLIDYMLVNFWVGNTDWPNHNWYAWRRSRAPGSLPWRFVSWDAEHTVKAYDENRLAVSDANSPGELFQLLRNNAEFRLRFADHAHKLMFNGGPLYTLPGTAAFWSPASTAGNVPATGYRKRVDEIWNSIVCESARWGDVATSRTNQPYTRELEYTRELNSLYTITNISGQTPNFFPLRGSNVLAQLKTAGLYPTNAAPRFSQYGGRVFPGYQLYIANLANSGTVYFTTNGVDPRAYGSGAVAPAAIAYTGGPVFLNGSTVVKARNLTGTNWSALNEATFDIDSLISPLRITEIMYNPPGGDAYEFIELLNTGTTDYDVSEFTFEGVAFTFPLATKIAAGARIVLANGANTNAFRARYPGVPIAGVFGGNLSNGGERLAIRDANGRTVLSVEYDDASGWPTAPDGGGYSLELIDMNGDPDAPANWRASVALNGTPGLPAVAPPASDVSISELMADNVTAVSNGGLHPDWIELFNAGASEVNLANWSLSDDGNPRKFVFPADTVIPGGGYLVVWCDTNSPAPGLHTGFALDREGDNVFLFDATTNRVDAVTFGLQLSDYTLARINGTWRLATPTPNAPNIAAPLDLPDTLKINEWLANAPPGGDDWIELLNTSASSLPVALRGIYLGTSNALLQVKALSFLAPGAYVQLFADEKPGANHLDFKLPAAGGAIILFDNDGYEVDRVTYGPQVQGVTQGRFPDGSLTITSFPGSASPGAANYVTNYTGAVLNEVLAINHSAQTNAAGHTADWVELFNSNATPFALAALGLSTDASVPSQWIFPPGATVPANGYLVVWFDNRRPASTANEPELNTGRALDGDGGEVWLFSAAGEPLDSVAYGFQIPDRSIGRSGGQWRLLTTPTPGASNATPAPLGATTTLRLNEWMANPIDGNDWFELFNPDTNAVALDGLFLSDDPSISGLTRFQIPPLSFIAAQGFVKWEADGDPSQGRQHVNFNLDALGEGLWLYRTNGGVIDGVTLNAQPPGVSEGRLPDGAPTVVNFPATSTPGESNYLPATNAVINQVYTRAGSSGKNSIELFNLSGQPINLSGWYLSDSRFALKKYRIPDGTMLAAGGFQTFYEVAFGSAFVLDPAHGGELWLSASDANGNLTGYRAFVEFGAAASGVPFGRVLTTLGADFTAMGSEIPRRTNGPPKIGPVIISEIMYHPPDILAGTNLVDDVADEFIELHNTSANSVPLFDPAHPTNTWRLGGGIAFAFPTNITLSAGDHLLVVSFDPLNTTALAEFRARYDLSTTVKIYGPYLGKLANSGASVELFQPDTPVAGGFVPQVLVDHVDFTDTLPWSAGAADGGGLSLQRRAANLYGNEPLNWLADWPTPGALNGAGILTPPMIAQSPTNLIALAGSPATFTVNAAGGALTYQWRYNGLNIPDATNAMFVLLAARIADEGSYDVFVSNAGGVAHSAAATLVVKEPPTITTFPLNQSGRSGTNITFTVAATGPEPITYQWQFNGTNLAGATSVSLRLTNVQLADTGTYTVLVSNPNGTIMAAATLTVLAAPVFTQQPQSATVVQGDTVTFSVSATGTQPLAYKWRRNGAALAGQTNPTLILTNVQTSQSGNYTVLLTNVASSAVLSATAVLVVLPDADGDHIPDGWETAFGFDPNNAADGLVDSDGDGFNNLQEYLAGTDPTNAASFLKIDSVQRTLTNTLLIQFSAVSNRTYTLLARDDAAAGTWNRAGDVNAAPTNRVMILIQPSPDSAPQRYFRLVTPRMP